MTDLIPLDAALAAIDSHAHGKTTLGGQTYRSITLEVAVEALQAIPAIDPAAIREAALEACTIIDDAVKEGHDNPIDLILHLLSAVEPARRALALIGEKK